MTTDPNAHADVNSLPENGTPSQTPAPAAPAQGTGDNWEDRFKGMQKHANSLQTQLNKKILEADALNTKLAELSVLVEQATTTATVQTSDLTQKLTAAQQEAQKHAARVQMYDLLSQDKYVELLPRYQKGILRPDGLEGDALTQYLDGFLADVQASRQGGVQQALSGATPPAPAPATGDSPKDVTTLQKALQTWRGSMNTPEYRALKDQYLAALAAQGKK